jgi:hypothetical protein
MDWRDRTLRGRLYWSEESWKRQTETFKVGYRHGVNSCLGRLDDGSEVEYNLLVSNPDAAEPAPEYAFLGIGEYVAVCRYARPEHPLEKVELELLRSRYVPEDLKQDTAFIEELANFFHSRQLGFYKPDTPNIPPPRFVTGRRIFLGIDGEEL